MDKDANVMGCCGPWDFQQERTWDAGGGEVPGALAPQGDSPGFVGASPSQSPPDRHLSVTVRPLEVRSRVGLRLGPHLESAQHMR